jgi:quinol monooxygenase YgiN
LEQDLIHPDKHREAAMLAVNRLQANGDDQQQLTAELSVLVDVFATLHGFLRARAGRCIDEPEVWILLTEWESVGTYRRALSSHAVKTSGYPVFLRIIDEPGAYEVLLRSN